MTQTIIQSKQAIDQLIGLGRMRVWSLVITVFGDAVMSRGGIVASSSLAALLAEANVKPEAFRVAMSRLTKDGFLERQKQGRLSFFKLSDRETKAFGIATKRIYAQTSGSADGWKLVALPSTLDPLLQDVIQLNSRLYLTQDADRFDDALVVSGPFERVPDWIKHRIGTEEIFTGYRELYEVLKTLDVTGASSLEAAILRILIVHHWRRLILRHADLPPPFFPRGWKGEECRTLVHQLLAQLAHSSDAWFDSEIG